MNFQYFFFDTYPGFFLEALPFALLAGVAAWMVRRRRNPTVSKGELLWTALLASWLTGLFCLTLCLNPLRKLWYFLLCHQDSGIPLRWFVLDYNLIPDFFRHWDRETIGNLLAFMPFGVLYPLSRRGAGVWDTLRAGTALVMAVELLEPVVGRAFDVNDIILNLAGILLAALTFRGIRGRFFGKEGK